MALPMRAMKAAMKAKKAPAKKAMKPAMKKAMKAMKSMKAMKKVKRVSTIAKGRGAKAAVLKGKKAKTSGGLTAAALTKNKAGRVVSKKKLAAGKKNKWAVACSQARKELKIKGFCPVGGKSEQGKKLLAKVRAIFKK